MTDRWTDNQLRAIQTVDRDVCVSAGAGSGKTGVLVERFLRIVRDSHEGRIPPALAAGVREILVITFTEKATREMKQRIVKSLAAAGLTDQRREVENAYISTIHGFCSRLLKENPFEAGVDPAFTVLEDAESRRMVRAAFEAALDHAFESDDEEIIELAAAAQNERIFGTDARDPIAALDAAVFSVLGKLRGAGLRQDELQELLDAGEAASSARGLAHVRSWVTPIVNEVGALRETLRGFENRTIGTLETKRRAVIDALADLADSSRIASWTDLGDTLTAIAEAGKRASGSPRPRANAPAVDNEISAALESMKTLARQLEPLKDFDPELEARAQVYAFRFLRLVLSTWTLYAESKRDQGGLDNDDLPAEAVNLLEKSPEVRRRYRRRFKHILVDEFQDTDPLQVRLLEALNKPEDASSPPNSLFMVGDVQQSIYAFRNADPSIFQTVVRDFRAMGDGRHVELAENFRSRPEILRFVNRIFQWAWRNAPSRFRALQPGAAFADKPEPSVEILVTADPGRPIYVDFEARAIAARIRELVGTEGLRMSSNRESETGRPVRFGDIAVLLRALTEIERYERAFTEAGIPYFVVGGGRGYYARYEIRDLMNILTVLDSPLEDHALLATLRSPFVGLDIDTIYALALFARGEDGKKRQPLYPVIPEFLASAASLPFDRFRLDDFYTKTESLAEMEDRIPVGQLLERLVAAFDYDQKLLVRPNGRRRLANLRKLLLMANSTAVHGVSDFNRRLREIERVSEREGDAPTEEEESDVVRLITIHKAKGLEFPVVFLADLGRSQWRPESGVFVCDPDTAAVGCRLEDYRSAVHHTISRSRQRVEDEESLRLLYVGMTRAIEHLVLCGSTARRSRGETWADLIFNQCGILAPPEGVEYRDLAYGDRIRVAPFFG